MGSVQQPRERLGLFGGSFDPIHLGHIRPVLAAVEALKLDRVMYLPTAQPPHKPNRKFAPALNRFAMVELALLGESRLQVSPFELQADGPTYTIDTLKHFQGAGREVYLLIGGDSYLELDTWRAWTELFELSTLVVLARPGFDRDAPTAVAAAAREHRVEWVEHELVDVSSTEVRAAVSRGDETGLLVPEPVLDYCSKYSLYR